MKISNQQPVVSSIISNANKIVSLRLEQNKKLWKNDYFKWVKDNWTSRGEPLDFEKHKYLIGVYQDQHPFIALMKSAQSGGIWLPDQYNENSMYLFPTSGTISDLVQERVDEPLSAKRYLREVSGRAKRIMGKHADKIGLKRMSKGFVYFRGSNKRTQITSVAGDAVFVDELDTMLQQNVPFFTKRLNHSKRKWQRWLSTPTIPNYGIHRIFLTTDQRHYFIKCNECGEWQELDFFKNVEKVMRTESKCESARLVCFKCRKDIVPWECEGEWRALKPENSDKHGYFLSKMYSPYLDLVEMVEESVKTAEWERLFPWD
jgi:phage terminase large subunit GpA-like protein